MLARSAARLARAGARARAPPAALCLAAARRGVASVAQFANGLELPLESALRVDVAAERPRLPCFRVMDEDGTVRADADPSLVLETERTVELYKTMSKLNTMDTIFYDAQRQGRISFYMTSYGEEAITIGSAFALQPDDEVFAQYREQGVLMQRGFSLQDFADQCYSNVDEPAKGRQMPVHYTSAELHFQTISSPLATQLPQAAGAAYALKLGGEKRIAVCYFGEGAASEGDFHAALNFAATLDCPVLFICRNNGFAISTPTTDQYRGDGIASRAAGYGIDCARADGNDLFAVVSATAAARKRVADSNKPFFLELMSYRRGHHSTSDDSTRYREAAEIESWADRGPLTRLQRYLTSQGAWDEEQEAALRKTLRKQVLTALTKAEKKPKPPSSALFQDVFSDLPWHLREQQEHMRSMEHKYPDFYRSAAH